MIMADYKFSILKDNVLLIVDLKNPNKATLTNSLEMVLNDLKKKQNLDWSQYTIIQKDSEDCFNHVVINRDNEFNPISWKHLSDSNLMDALKKLKAK